MDKGNSSKLMSATGRECLELKLADRTHFTDHNLQIARDANINDIDSADLLYVGEVLGNFKALENVWDEETTNAVTIDVEETMDDEFLSPVLPCRHQVLTPLKALLHRQQHLVHTMI